MFCRIHQAYPLIHIAALGGERRPPGMGLDSGFSEGDPAPGAILDDKRPALREEMQLLTPRLILRPWRDTDRQSFAEMSRDPQVMQYLRPLATTDACNAWIDAHIAHHEAHGFCLWPCELRENGAFVGAVGICHVAFEAHFTPAVEIGWRTARQFWGQGYATEAADAALGFGFLQIGLPEIVAQAGTQNLRSRRVMERLGMSRDLAGDHDHPLLQDGDPLRRHVLYRLTREAWLTRHE